MKVKWGEEKIKGFSKLVTKAERGADWAWWALFVMLVVMAICFILKISEGAI